MSSLSMHEQRRSRATLTGQQRVRSAASQSSTIVTSTETELNQGHRAVPRYLLPTSASAKRLQAGSNAASNDLSVDASWTKHAACAVGSPRQRSSSASAAHYRQAAHDTAPTFSTQPFRGALYPYGRSERVRPPQTGDGHTPMGRQSLSTCYSSLRELFLHERLLRTNILDAEEEDLVTQSESFVAGIEQIRDASSIWLDSPVSHPQRSSALSVPTAAFGTDRCLRPRGGKQQPNHNDEDGEDGVLVSADSDEEETRIVAEFASAHLPMRIAGHVVTAEDPSSLGPRHASSFDPPHQLTASSSGKDQREEPHNKSAPPPTAEARGGEPQPLVPAVSPPEDVRRYLEAMLFQNTVLQGQLGEVLASHKGVLENLAMAQAEIARLRADVAAASAGSSSSVENRSSSSAIAPVHPFFAKVVQQQPTAEAPAAPVPSEGDIPSGTGGAISRGLYSAFAFSTSCCRSRCARSRSPTLAASVVHSVPPLPRQPIGAEEETSCPTQLGEVMEPRTDSAQSSVQPSRQQQPVADCLEDSKGDLHREEDGDGCATVEIERPYPKRERRWSF
jgi:hypothetical protein